MDGLKYSAKDGPEQGLLFRAHSDAESFPAMVHITDGDGVLIQVSDQWLQVLGYNRSEVLGCPLTQFFTKPTAVSRTISLPAPAARQTHDEISTRMRTKTGELIDVVINTTVQHDADGVATAQTAVIRNVTSQLNSEQQLRDSERRARVMKQLSEATRAVHDPDRILPVALALLGQHLGASRCAFAHVDPDGEWFTIPHDYTDGCASTAGRYRLSLFGPQAVTALTRGRTYVVRDVDTELARSGGAEMFNTIGIKAIVCCAYLRGGVLRAMMAVHQIEPRDWTDSEIEITQAFVEHCWAAIEQRRAEFELRRSEALLRIANRAAKIGEWSIDVPSGRVNWSDETCAMHDVAAGTEPTLEQALSFFTAECRDTLQNLIQACIVEGEPFDVEVQLVSASQRRLWVRAFGLAERNTTGEVVRFQGAYQDISERKLSEIALAESHESLRVTLMSIGDAVITTDPDGFVEWMNPVSERLTGWTAEQARGRPLQQVFHIVNEETRLPTENPVATCLAQGKVVGLANHTLLLSQNGEEYGIEDSAAPIRDEAGTVLGVVLVFHNVTEQRRLSNEMTYRASHDDLTDLFNRTEFESRLGKLLQQSHENKSRHAMMFIDLDEFKLVNDACGHSVGDQLLQQVSKLLRDSVRAHDTVARLGGDEFGVLLDHCSIDQAQRIAQQICDRMEEHRFQHDEHRFRIGTSIGLVPVDISLETTAAVMQAADTSCYAAKEAGRNRFHTWFDTDAAMRERHGEMKWTTRIERALDENSFELFGQRIECLARVETGLRFEVLLRMRDDDGSFIAPNAFLPAAERYHLITRVDRWVLDKATSWLSALPDLGAVAMLSINLSGQSIGDRSFHSYVVEHLVELGPKICQRLCLEITETAAITNMADASRFIEQVHDLGVRIALDDFGSGASSFGYLKSLNVDYLKIDGQFIKDLLEDPLDDVAVRCFVDVARVVGLETVAEFVDCPYVLKRVKELGIDFGQGFLLHKPGPIEGLLQADAQEG